MVESLKYLEYFTDESPRELASLGDRLFQKTSKKKEEHTA